MTLLVNLEALSQMLDPAGEKYDPHIPAAGLFVKQLALLAIERLVALCHNEVAPCREKKCAGPEIQAEINRRKPAQQHACPNRNKSVHRHACAATGITCLKSSDRTTHMRSIDPRVGVNEEQILALRRGCAR